MKRCIAGLLILQRGAVRVGAMTALFSLVVACCALATSFAAQSAESSAIDALSQLDIPDPTQAGRPGQIYLERCAACHDKGIDRAPRRNLFVDMSPQSVYRALTDGVMRGQAQGLSDADRIAVAEFVTRRRMNDAATAREPPACKQDASRFDVDEPPIFSGWGLSPGNTRFVSQSLAGLDRESVRRLRLKWAVAFPNAVQVRSAPTLAAGALYVGSHNGGVYALDRKSGCARWIFQAGSEVRTGIVVSPWRAGDRAAQPRAYFGDIASNVYAIDARSGKLIWRVKADENASTITGTPTLHEDTLYVPVSSNEALLPSDPNYVCCKFRGSVIAYDTASGEVKWQAYTTDVPRITGKNSHGVDRYGPSGAPIWNSPTIDVARRQLYVGTGQNYSSPSNDKSDAVLALDLATGAVRWVYQGRSRDAINLACLVGNDTNCPNEEDGADLDFGGGSPMLVSLTNGRQVIVAGQKSGDVHALDPDNGRLIWRKKVGRGGMLGGVHFGLAASGSSVFVPISDAPDGLDRQEPARPGVYALAAADGRELWSAPFDAAECAGSQHCMAGYSQSITATPELVFAGTHNGWMRAFDARSGAVLWQVDTKKPVETVNGNERGGGSFAGGAGPVVYRGMVFVSSGYSFGTTIPSNLLLAFEAE